MFFFPQRICVAFASCHKWQNARPVTSRCNSGLVPLGSRVQFLRAQSHRKRLRLQLCFKPCCLLGPLWQSLQVWIMSCSMLHEPCSMMWCLNHACLAIVWNISPPGFRDALLPLLLGLGARPLLLVLKILCLPCSPGTILFWCLLSWLWGFLCLHKAFPKSPRSSAYAKPSTKH